MPPDDPNGDMIPLRKIIPIREAKKKITHDERIALWGSCFADHLRNYLEEELFFTSSSPFGIMYNPVSMAEGVRRVLKGDAPKESELMPVGGLWTSPMHHGAFSDIDKGVALSKMRASFEETRGALSETRLFVFTFGTAYIYEDRANGNVVNNCHKRPSTDFGRRRADIAEIRGLWIPIIEQLLSLNHSAEVLFTISPIPHYRDGAHENRVSKAVLHLALEELLEHFSSERVRYFPAYEIMQDELRDYRFYETDFAHPTRLAVDYIMERFRETYLAPWALEAEWHKVRGLLVHRPFTQDPEKLRRHYGDLRARLTNLREKFAHPLLDAAINETLYHDTI